MEIQGKLNPSLLNLKHLSYLDLSNNNFGGMQIPKFLGSLKSLRYLNLSSSGFGGAVPHELGNLSNLHYLDLGDHNALLFEANNLQWISGLSSLRYLDLSFVDLSKTKDHWLQVTSKLPGLIELHLSSCNIHNVPSPISVNYTSLTLLDLSQNQISSSVPIWIFSLPSLVYLDLSGNAFGGSIPDGFRNMSCLEVLDLASNSLNSSIPSSLYSLNRLKFLNLSENMLQGEISNNIGNLSSVVTLGLSAVDFQGKVPKSLGNLCNLRQLNLSNNQIHQEIAEILQFLSVCGLERLESLDVANNQLFGPLTQLGVFKNLAYLSLSRNSISGPIPVSVGKLSCMKKFDVSNNQLNGTLPRSFGQLANLEYLMFAQNQMEGVVSEILFANLTRLRKIKASQNKLTFKPKPSWIPPFQCEIIELGDWFLGPKFPQWLQHQVNLFILDIANAGISGTVPSWFWNVSPGLMCLNLSNNHLTGEIPDLSIAVAVDLRSNQFKGRLPRVSQTMAALFLSENLFSGSLSNFLCNSTSETKLSLLHVETNLLSGEIPDCWMNWRSLQDLRLANNNLTGKIPGSMGSKNLISLNLRNNSLSGELPMTLQHCTSLYMLDLSENQFNGSLPLWIGKRLSKILILSLRSNNFHGHIPDEFCDLGSLQILDLAHNNISGAIPKCFGKFSAMATTQNDTNHIISYRGEVLERQILVINGRDYEYSTTLKLVTSLDLSNNILTGSIPKELGTLRGLLSLNLSSNFLTGRIPESIGNMGLLESLDFSRNQLNGQIPLSFSNLNFLNHLNLSYNNLAGKIPSSTQLQSFDKFSYIGNQLYGPPLDGETPDHVTHGSSKVGSNKLQVNWFYVSAVLGFQVGFWGVVAPLYFIKSWRIAYYRKLNTLCLKLSLLYMR